MWRNNHLWAGVAVDEEGVGGKERGSHWQYGQTALGQQLGAWACFVNKEQWVFSTSFWDRIPSWLIFWKELRELLQCDAESRLEGCIWATHP